MLIDMAARRSSKGAPCALVFLRQMRNRAAMRWEPDSLQTILRATFTLETKEAQQYLRERISGVHLNLATGEA